VTATAEFLTVEDVEFLHEEQLRLFGGLQGVRDRAALESAVAVPTATFAGEFLHKDLFSTAAAYAYHLAESQAFLDGNKRTALNAALVFLGLNGWDVDDPEGLLFYAMIGIAERRVSKLELAELLQRLAVPYVED
jgi:death-on-curing protein